MIESGKITPQAGSKRAPQDSCELQEPEIVISAAAAEGALVAPIDIETASSESSESSDSTSHASTSSLESDDFREFIQEGGLFKLGSQNFWRVIGFLDLRATLGIIESCRFWGLDHS